MGGCSSGVRASRVHGSDKRHTIVVRSTTLAAACCVPLGYLGSVVEQQSVVILAIVVELTRERLRELLLPVSVCAYREHVGRPCPRRRMSYTRALDRRRFGVSGLAARQVDAIQILEDGKCFPRVPRVCVSGLRCALYVVS